MDSSDLSLCLAPIRGVTDAAWRSAFSQLFGGFDDAVAPFVKPADGQLKASALQELGPVKNTALPVIPQLLVNDPHAFVAAARQLEQNGATVVNWNLGCPMPTSTRKKLGAGLLPHVDEIDRFLEIVFTQVAVKVSIKTRLGERDPAEIDRLIPVFNRYPLCEVIVHPRIATGQYEGLVDLDAFERVARLIVHPVVYNGDIFSAAQFAQMRQRFPTIQRWMIGRGALLNPYLPSEIRGVPRVDVVERRKALGAFHDQLYATASAERSGFSHVHARMVQIWEYLSVAIGADGHFEKKLRKAKTPAMYDSLVRPLLDR